MSIPSKKKTGAAVKESNFTAAFLYISYVENYEENVEKGGFCVENPVKFVQSRMETPCKTGKRLPEKPATAGTAAVETQTGAAEKSGRRHPKETTPPLGKEKGGKLFEIGLDDDRVHATCGNDRTLHRCGFDIDLAGVGQGLQAIAMFCVVNEYGHICG